MGRLDPSIILAGSNDPYVDTTSLALNKRRNYLAAQREQLANQLDLEKIGQARLQAQEAAHARGALKNYLLATEQDPKKREFIEASPDAYQSFMGNQAGMDKTKAETDAKRAGAQKVLAAAQTEKIVRLAQMLRNVNDQEGWSAVREFIAQEEGPESLASIPEQFNPRLSSALLNATLKESDRLSAETTRRGQDIAAATARRGQDINAKAAVETARVLSEKEQRKEQKEQTELQKTLNVYRQARQGLLSGLEGTETGPVIGLTPAFTTGQQIGEGAVAAMAPVLKQLFRAAGEGVFTDRDQALLMDMVPKRTDSPEARAAKIENIDRIVSAKLGIDFNVGDAQSSGAQIQFLGFEE